MKFREPKKQSPDGLCHAQLRGKPGRYCRKPAMHGRNRCELHGGKTPRGVKSPHYKTGIYGGYLTTELKDKMDKLDTENPLDLLPELGILRALLATYLQNLKKKKQDETFASEINVISDLISRISNTVNNIVKIRNDTAITASELKLIALRIAELSAKYIPDEQVRSDYLREIFTTAIPVDESLEIESNV
jgi:hypothetical protein